MMITTEPATPARMLIAIVVRLPHRSDDAEGGGRSGWQDSVASPSSQWKSFSVGIAVFLSVRMLLV
jgi:hypothetical protein